MLAWPSATFNSSTVTDTSSSASLLSEDKFQQGNLSVVYFGIHSRASS